MAAANVYMQSSCLRVKSELGRIEEVGKHYFSANEIAKKKACSLVGNEARLALYKILKLLQQICAHGRHATLVYYDGLLFLLYTY